MTFNSLIKQNLHREDLNKSLQKLLLYFFITQVANAAFMGMHRVSQRLKSARLNFFAHLLISLPERNALIYQCVYIFYAKQQIVFGLVNHRSIHLKMTEHEFSNVKAIG